MIQIGVQTGGPEEFLGIDGAYRMIAECGFEGVDANVDHLLTSKDVRAKMHAPAFDGDDKTAVEYFHPWKDAAVKYGISNFQAHAPFPSHLVGEDGAYNEYMMEVLRKTIIGCDSMDCHRLVIHPFFQGYPELDTPEMERERNLERYAHLIPTAKQYGVTLCLENMFVVNRGKVYASCCSDITRACEYVDELNRIAGEKLFGFCVDTGHLLLCSIDIKNAITELGDRIECFHVHDNDGRDDLHMPPYTGVLDWERFMEGLQAIGFNKTLCFETFRIHQLMDPALSPSINRYIHDCGRRFAQQGFRP